MAHLSYRAHEALHIEGEKQSDQAHNCRSDNEGISCAAVADIRDSPNRLNLEFSAPHT